MVERNPIRSLVRLPLVVAPMAGGPSTVALVAAAAAAGAVGWLAGGYKTAEAVRAEIDLLRASTGMPFGLNLFVPGSPTADVEGLDSYVRSMRPEALAVGADVGDPAWDDDDWDAKLDVAIDRAPAIVSFTFGCPPPDVIAALRAAGVLVAVTVTTPEEARLCAAAEVDCLCLQGSEAGAHRGSFPNDDREGQDYGLYALIAAVQRVTDLPLLAAGGLAGPDDVAAVLRAGATGAQMGTAFLRCTESGASPVHKAALADARFSGTRITRAFSGRRARALVNDFMVRHPAAPAAYPEINNATRPIRAAAAALGDADIVSLYAGQGFRAAEDVSAGEIIEHLVQSLPNGDR